MTKVCLNRKNNAARWNTCLAWGSCVCFILAIAMTVVFAVTNTKKGPAMADEERVIRERGVTLTNMVPKPSSGTKGAPIPALVQRPSGTAAASNGDSAASSVDSATSTSALPEKEGRLTRHLGELNRAVAGKCAWLTGNFRRHYVRCELRILLLQEA